LKVSVASPCPAAAEVNVIQFTGVAALHEQSRVTPIERLPAPPDAANVVDDMPTFAWHRVAVGAVIDVEVFDELPQAVEKSATRNSRADERGITVSSVASLSPVP
jgi:hypothetical protein